MTIANVTILNTFDDWRKTTNELIVFAYQTNDRLNASYTASNSAYAAVNSAIATAANISTNLLIANDVVIGILSNSSNAIANAYIQNSDFLLVKIQANAAYLQSNIAFDQSNTSLSLVNTFTSNVTSGVANILASNTVIIEAVNTTANLVILDLVANSVIGGAYNTANNAYTQSNNAYTQSNNAYDLANVVSSKVVVSHTQANNAYTQANNAYTQANNAYTQSNNAYTQANNAYTQANNAYDQSNNVIAFASLAYDQANVAISDATNANTLALSAYNLAVNAGGSIFITDELVSSNTYYVTFLSDTTGQAADINVSSTKLTFNPSTGTLSSTVFNSLSDAELKDNIKPIINSLDIVSAMSGVGFNWKDTGNKSFGVIAQDIEKIVPELVSDINNTKTVNYDGIIAFLIEAIKQLNAKLEEKN